MAQPGQGKCCFFPYYSCHPWDMHAFLIWFKQHTYFLTESPSYLHLSRFHLVIVGVTHTGSCSDEAKPQDTFQVHTAAWCLVHRTELGQVDVKPTWSVHWMWTSVSPPKVWLYSWTPIWLPHLCYYRHRSKYTAVVLVDLLCKGMKLNEIPNMGLKN